MDGAKFLRKLALTHGNVITMDRGNPRVQAVLVSGSIIFKVGTNEEIKALVDEETEVIDLEGRTIIPGFVDCHAHPMAYGQFLMGVDCRTPPIGSIKQMVERIREEAEGRPPGEWILGRGYDDFKLQEKRHPNRWDLDEAAPDNPVMITRLCGHVSTVNSLALKLAGISRESRDPDGGQIDRDPATGEPTGVLRGAARRPVRDLIPQPDVERLRRGINLTTKEFLARGVTSVSEAGVSDPKIVRAYQSAVREDGIPLRVNLMMSAEVLEELRKLGAMTGFGDDRLRIGAIKMVADGSCSGRTAAVSEAYLDTPGNRGIMYINREKMFESVLSAHKAGFQVGVHAIGDRAVSVVLDAYEVALKELPRVDHRLRIEHCGICSQAVVSRIRELGVVPVPQPIFLHGEGESYRAGLGEDRARWVYPLRSFLENGIAAPMSSDCPATSGSELISPLLGIYVAVTRKTDAGREIGPEQRINAEDALRCYTLNGAYATFEDHIKGSIEPGKLADFAVLSDDPLGVEPEKIKDIEVYMTVLGGETVYRRPDKPPTSMRNLG